MDFSIAALLGVAEDASALANALAVAWRVLIVLLGVNMLIIVHEWGHFIVARMCGVRCDKFYIWFDAYGFKFFSFKWGDTEYGLGWLPLGGYVKMLGQEDNPGGIQAEIERAKLERSEKDGELSAEEKAAKDEEIAALEKQAFAPDSYLAKNVFQRMAIISAGVFMNVVFAIVCATAAILIGTPETSARIGYVAPGSPAWKSGMQAGDEIVGINENKNPVFSSIIVATMDGKETNFDVLRPGADAPTTLAIQPRFNKGDMNPTIGVGPSISLDLAAISGGAPFASSLDAQEAAQIEERLGALTGGERLVSMNGVPVETPADQYRLARLFIDRPIEYVFAPTVVGKAGERSVDETKEKIAVTIPPTGAPEIGVRLTMGEIVEIRPGSAAEKAGLRKREVDETGAVTQRGDVLLEIDAEPILDPRLLPYRLFASGSKETRPELAAKTAATKAENSENAENATDSKKSTAASGAQATAPTGTQTVALTVLRDGERVDLTATLPNAAPYDGFASSRGAMACGRLGVAFEVLPVVSGIDGTVKTDANPIGGEIVKIEATVPDPGADAAKEARELFKALTGAEAGAGAQTKTTEIVGETDAERAEIALTWLSSVAPLLPNGTPVVVTVEAKDGVEAKIETTLRRAEDAFIVERGLYFGGDAIFHRADSLGEALSFGVAKTWECATMIFTTLKNLGSTVSAKALGGPGMIVGTAYAAAGEQNGVFLLFLCMISANLAVVNFLPIPVLDGGHIVFLLYEAITRRKPNENVQVILSYMGLALILALMFWVIYLDVVRYCF